jgi:hypothetical protein
VRRRERGRSGPKPYDRTRVLPTQNLPAGAFVTQIFNTGEPESRALPRVQHDREAARSAARRMGLRRPAAVA